MRPCRLYLLIGVGLSACAVPFRTSSEERKAPCDRLAAQAIQASSLQDAKALSAQASECYAKALEH